jgi:hypothetical protein
MSREKKRNDEEWTKIDVKKETRDKLQAHKYLHKYSNLDEIISEWLKEKSSK